MVIEILFATAVVSAAIDPLRQDVVCAEVGFSRSVENHDFEAFIAFIDPEARFDSGRVSRGPEEIGQSWAGFFAPNDLANVLHRPVEITTQSRHSQVSPTPHQGGPIDAVGRSRWQLRKSGPRPPQTLVTHGCQHRHSVMT